MFKKIATTDSRFNPEVGDVDSSSEITALKKYKAIVIMDIPVLKASGEDSLENLASMEGGMYINSTTSKDYIVDYLKKASVEIDTAYNGLTLNDMKMKVFLQTEALKMCKASSYDIIFTRNSDWTKKEDSKINKYIEFSVSKSKFGFGISIISSDKKYSLYELIKKGYRGAEKHRGFMIDTHCCKDTFTLKDLSMSYSELKMFKGVKPGILNTQCLINSENFFKYKMEQLLYSSLENKKETNSKSKLVVFNTAIPYGIWDKNSLKKYGVDVSGIEFDTVMELNDVNLTKEREYIILPTAADLESFVVFSKDINSMYAAEAFYAVIGTENSSKFYDGVTFSDSLINYDCDIQDKLSDISSKMDIRKALDTVMINGSLIKADFSELCFYSNIIFLLDVSFRRIFEGESTNGENISMTVLNIVEKIKEDLKENGIISNNTTFETSLSEVSAGKYKLVVRIKDEDESKEFEYSIDISNS